MHPFQVQCATIAADLTLQCPLASQSQARVSGAVRTEVEWTPAHRGKLVLVMKLLLQHHLTCDEVLISLPLLVPSHLDAAKTRLALFCSHFLFRRNSVCLASRSYHTLCVFVNNSIALVMDSSKASIKRTQNPRVLLLHRICTIFHVGVFRNCYAWPCTSPPFLLLVCCGVLMTRPQQKPPNCCNAQGLLQLKIFVHHVLIGCQLYVYSAYKDSDQSAAGKTNSK